MDTNNIHNPEQILNCLHCGGKAEVITTKCGYGDTAVIVRCTNCRIGTAPIIEGVYARYRGTANKTFTINEARKEVVRVWNTTSV